MLEPLHDVVTGTPRRLASEGAFLAALDGFFETPIAGLATLKGFELLLRGEVLLPNGSEKLSGQWRGPIEQCAAVGEALAQDLLSQAGPRFFSWH